MFNFIYTIIHTVLYYNKTLNCIFAVNIKYIHLIVTVNHSFKISPYELYEHQQPLNLILIQMFLKFKFRNHMDNKYMQVNWISISRGHHKWISHLRIIIWTSNWISYKWTSNSTCKDTNLDNYLDIKFDINLQFGHLFTRNLTWHLIIHYIWIVYWMSANWHEISFQLDITIDIYVHIYP